MPVESCDPGMSLGQIAAEIGHPVRRVKYVIRNADLKPIRTVSRINLYAISDVTFIRMQCERAARDSR